MTRRRARAWLVAAQVAVALILLGGAGLFARSLAVALAVNPGFDANRIVTGDVRLFQHGYTPEQASRFFDELRQRLGSAPEVASASVIHRLGSMGSMGWVTVDAVPRHFPSELYYVAVDERYFETMGMPILRGRGFTRADTMSSSLVVVVSESLAREVAGTDDPIGHRITETSLPFGATERAVAEIVGVVPDVITNVADTSPLVKYYTMRQRDPFDIGTVVARARPAGEGVNREIFAAVRSIDPHVTPSAVRTIEERLRSQMSPQDLGTFVLGALGTIAVVLTLLGAYVLSASMSALRRREFCIRRVLGATRSNLGGLVLVETVRLVGVGLVAGLGLAWIGAGTIRSFLFRVEPLDPTVLLSVSAAILAVTLLVSLRPALDAARVDIAPLLREE